MLEKMVGEKLEGSEQQSAAEQTCLATKATPFRRPAPTTAVSNNAIIQAPWRGKYSAGKVF